jgi:hypothetical protein
VRRAGTGRRYQCNQLPVPAHHIAATTTTATPDVATATVHTQPAAPVAQPLAVGRPAVARAGAAARPAAPWLGCG